MESGFLPKPDGRRFVTAAQRRAVEAIRDGRAQIVAQQVLAELWSTGFVAVKLKIAQRRDWAVILTDAGREALGQ